jgi:hypothetical protein
MTCSRLDGGSPAGMMRWVKGWAEGGAERGLIGPWACSGEGSRGIQNDQEIGSSRVVVVVIISIEPNGKRKDEDEK